MSGDAVLRWRGRDLHILRLPVESMGRLAACAPAMPGEREILAALLAGARVYLEPGAAEYRRCRAGAGDGVYIRCVALERQLREMGVRRGRRAGR